jgi:hypothetical protein
MALGFAQSLREMSTRNIPGAKMPLALKAYKLTTIFELIF